MRLSFPGIYFWNVHTLMVLILIVRIQIKNIISERKPTFCACSFAEIICTLLVHHQTCFCLKNNTLRVSFWPYYTSYKNPFATKFADNPSLMLHSWNTQTLFGKTFISQYFFFSRKFWSKDYLLTQNLKS